MRKFLVILTYLLIFFLSFGEEEDIRFKATDLNFFKSGTAKEEKRVENKKNLEDDLKKEFESKNIKKSEKQQDTVLQVSTDNKNFNKGKKLDEIRREEEERKRKEDEAARKKLEEMRKRQGTDANKKNIETVVKENKDKPLILMSIFQEIEKNNVEKLNEIQIYKTSRGNYVYEPRYKSGDILSKLYSENVIAIVEKPKYKKIEQIEGYSIIRKGKKYEIKAFKDNSQKKSQPGTEINFKAVGFQYELY